MLIKLFEIINYNIYLQIFISKQDFDYLDNSAFLINSYLTSNLFLCSDFENKD